MCKSVHMRHGEYKKPGGKLVIVDFSVRDGRIMDVQINGDFFLEPDSALEEINRALDGMPVTAGADELAAAVSRALDDDVAMA